MPMHSSHVSKSTSTVTVKAASTITTTTVTTSGVSQPESAARQRQQGSFVGLPATVHTPESKGISLIYHQQDEPGLLSETGTTQIDPFEALATYKTAIFDDDDQGQSASSLSLSKEPSRSQKASQPVDDVVPFVREGQSPNPTDKWIVMTDDGKKPLKCGFKGCGRKYSKKESLQTHFVTHAGDSKLRCHLGGCAGKVIYPNTRALTQHIQAHHTFERPFGCKLCDRRFRLQHHLNYHMKHVHSIEEKKKLPKRHSVSKSSSARATSSTAGTSAITSGNSQPESAAGQRVRAHFMGLSKTAHTPDPTQTPEANQQFSGLRLLANVSSSQIDSFDDEAVTTGIAGVPNLPSDQYQAEQIPDPTDTRKWIMVDNSQERPYKCGYPEGCDKTYLTRHNLTRHFVKHTGTSKFKCPHPECVGNEYFGEGALLKRHIIIKHARYRPLQCELCDRRFKLQHHLKYHLKYVHDIGAENKPPKRKKK